MYRFVSTPPDPAADNFVIFFFEDINGLPDLTPFASYSVGSDVNRVSTGLTILEQENQVLRTEFSYVATIPPTLLQAGTPYYLAIWNNPGFSLAGWSWASGAAGDTVNYGSHVQARYDVVQTVSPLRPASSVLAPCSLPSSQTRPPAAGPAV
jgi:hypothetical protein